MLLKEVSEQLL